MHKPFDLDAAKRGELVEYRAAGGRWGQVHFVGEAICGSIVIQIKGQLISVDAIELRMAPKKVTVRYRVAAFIDPDGAVWTDTTNTPGKELLMAAHLDFKEWLTDWQEVEITPPEST